MAGWSTTASRSYGRCFRKADLSGFRAARFLEQGFKTSDGLCVETAESEGQTTGERGCLGCKPGSVDRHARI